MATSRRFLCLFALAAASASAVTDKTLHSHAHRSSESSEENLLQDAFAFLTEKHKQPKPVDPDAQVLWHQRKPTTKELAARIKSQLSDDDKANAPNRATANPLKDEPVHRVVLKRAKAKKAVVPQASVKSPQQVAKLDAAGDTRTARSALPAAEKQTVEGKLAIPAHAPVHLAKETEEEQSQVQESAKAPEVDQPPTEEQLTQGATESEEADQQVERPDLPFSELQPFGRRNVGESLTESSVSQSNAMVDQLERAEVAEEKRAVFRSLTRLRGVALSSFDGIARSQTGNIEDYAEHHHWRSNHPVKHLAEEESDVKSWAFPANADFF